MFISLRERNRYPRANLSAPEASIRSEGGRIAIGAHRAEGREGGGRVSKVNPFDSLFFPSFSCYKADRAGDGVPVRRGAPVREVVAESSGREARPAERQGDGGDSLRCSLSQRHGVRTGRCRGKFTCTVQRWLFIELFLRHGILVTVSASRDGKWERMDRRTVAKLRRGPPAEKLLYWVVRKVLILKENSKW